ncbi:Androgen-induced protein 1 [Pteropus alecto]|uniref:Androgen-induced protein 1 n=1 Tax=Pteropus alecto TaxID=9402 RepID=L5KGM4_PTEAL|nr:Androgen-induced protein 1 [Pteropus alecto]
MDCLPVVTYGLPHRFSVMRWSRMRQMSVYMDKDSKAHYENHGLGDAVIQAVFFGICVLTDLSSLLTRGSGNQEQERQLKKLISLRDWMLAVLAFPVGFFVVAVFWIIYAYDREMIYPKLLDNFIPGWLNHGMHTMVLPFILIEMRTSHHAYPSRSSGLAATCIFSVAYILWVYWLHHVTGMWVYPFLEHIGPGARIIFFGSAAILTNFLYLLGDALNSYMWDTQRSEYYLGEHKTRKVAMRYVQ